MNFAFIGMHEAYAATGESQYKTAEDKIANFLVRAQVRSRVHPGIRRRVVPGIRLDKYEYWTSSSDSGWGPWCTESGWSQSWIVTTFALRILKRSLWDGASMAPDFGGFVSLRDSMFPMQDSEPRIMHVPVIDLTRRV